MQHRKSCGCLVEIEYKSTIRGLKMIAKTISFCNIHKEQKQKDKHANKNNRKRRVYSQE